ncbi:MAG: hypothetical protein KGZ82_10190 [Bacteroidales bacterium]|nr:hypothetical protein [Bacteroidales bacterium]
MKQSVIVASMLAFCVLILAPGCNKKTETNNETFGYEYYKGAIPNSYYIYNFMEERALKVSGKPFMVVKYDKITHNILDFEFGLSEVTQTAVPGASFGVAPEPTLDASSIDYQEKLGLVSPVDLLINWPVTAWGYQITNESLNGGGLSFSFSGYGSKWTFSYLPAGSMTGGAVILDYTTGRETDAANSINMLRL